MRKLLLLSISVYLFSCAQLHHVQLGDVTSHPDFVAKPFDIKLSESGVNIQEAAGTAAAVLDKKHGDDAKAVAGIIGLFQMGPRTGNPVYVKGYAKNLIQLIYEKCPSGKVTGLMSIRESRKYPIVSGEIVHITGYCLLRKGS